MQEFLGFGLLRPLRRDQKADFAAAGGEQLIRSAAGQILGTIGASEATPGELPWRTDFGSLLHRLRHQKNEGPLHELARVYVVDALERWEPRIIVTAVTVQREQHDGEIVLAIRICDVFLTRCKETSPGPTCTIDGTPQFDPNPS